MSKYDDKESEREDRELVSIFAFAKPRPAPPEHVARRVRKAVHAEWQAQTTESGARRRRRYLAFAASVMVAVALGLFFLARPAPVSPVFDSAQVVRVTGQVRLVSASGRKTPLAGGKSLSLWRGDAIETGAGGGISIQLGGGRELRVGPASHTVFSEAGRIGLERGRLYLDSAQDEQLPGGIVIDTIRGRVRHLGTRFLVALADSTLRVDVRDGHVEVEGRAGGPKIAGPGQVITVSDDTTLVGNDGAFGPQWRWAEELVPPLAIEGMTLYAVISWAAQESGRSVEFANADLEAASRETRLHGNLVLTDPLRGLSQAMLTTRMDYSLDKEVIVIMPRT